MDLLLVGLMQGFLSYPFFDPVLTGIYPFDYVLLVGLYLAD